MNTGINFWGQFMAFSWKLVMSFCRDLSVGTQELSWLGGVLISRFVPGPGPDAARVLLWGRGWLLCPTGQAGSGRAQVALCVGEQRRAELKALVCSSDQINYCRNVGEGRENDGRNKRTWA